MTSVTIGKSVTLVDQDAFTGCDKLSTIYCKAQTPPKLGYSRLYPFQGLVYSPAFDTTHYQNSTLYVPKGCADIYSSADNWSNFRNIVEMDFVPDIDGDGKADIADINAAVNVMLGLESNDTYGGRADIDGDNKVDVADLNAIVNAMLSGESDTQ